MSTEWPPNSSERARSLKLKPGQQSKRAICFETPRDGGERVRLAEDIDPIYADSITVSEPDGREYEDVPPELPKPGSGEQYDECGEDIPILLCHDCGSPTWVGNTCRRSRCPRCWQSWVFQRAVEATTAIDGTRRKRWTETSGDMYNHHVVVSPPKGTRFNSEEPVDRLMDAAKVLLCHVNADTGYLIYHPNRIKEEYRGDIPGHESGEGDMNWADILSLPPEEREEYLVHSPHIHAFAVSENVQTETVAPDIYDETGMVIHRVADDRGRSLPDMESLAAAVAYSLSHAGISYDEEHDAHRAETRFFGETAQIERRESVRKEAEAAMREVAGNVLGVSFRRRACQNVVSDGSEDSGDSEDLEDLPLSVRALTDTDERDTPAGGAPSASVGMSSPGSSGFDSGGSDGFGFGGSGASPSGGSGDSSAGGAMPARSEDGDMDGHDHDHSEGETCGGQLVPIWKAPEYLADDEWREQIGEETAEELEAAYEEWVDMGKPVPDDLPSDAAEPPPD